MVFWGMVIACVLTVYAIALSNPDWTIQLYSKLAQHLERRPRTPREINEEAKEFADWMSKP